jgi:hypothetical protein
MYVSAFIEEDVIRFNIATNQKQISVFSHVKRTPVEAE